jgi:2-polyprenyl-3-methyl-5-hydroxy-6-metoxy-1,4-benzoquinol methylase
MNDSEELSKASEKFDAVCTLEVVLEHFVHITYINTKYLL